MLLQQGFEPRSYFEGRGLRRVSGASREGASSVPGFRSLSGRHESAGRGVPEEPRAQILLLSPEDMPSVGDVKPGTRSSYSYRQLAAMPVL